MLHYRCLFSSVQRTPNSAHVTVLYWNLSFCCFASLRRESLTSHSLPRQPTFPTGPPVLHVKAWLLTYVRKKWELCKFSFCIKHGCIKRTGYSVGGRVIGKWSKTVWLPGSKTWMYYKKWIQRRSSDWLAFFSQGWLTVLQHKISLQLKHFLYRHCIDTVRETHL